MQCHSALTALCLGEPHFQEASSQALHLESTLADLPLFQYGLEMSCPGRLLAQVLEAHPDLPGVLLLNQGRGVGLLGRQRFLEFLLRPQGYEWFLEQPLRVLWSYARCSFLALPETTPILLGAQQALRRSPDQRADPIVVRRQNGDLWLLDIHELTLADWQLRGIETQVRYERMQMRMIQHEKMAALGRLVDGVAHEILDPVGFIWGNLVHLSEYMGQMMQLLAAYEAHNLQDEDGAIAHLRDDIEWDYVKNDLPRTLQSIQTGADRLKQLAMSLQNFCHIDDVYPRPADLHDCLDSLVLLLESHLTGEIRFTRQYGHLPPVSCYLGQLNQVFVNLLTRAVDTLLNPALRSTMQAEQLGEAGLCPKPEIVIKTWVQTDPIAHTGARGVVISIADNGPALSADALRQIRECFSIEQRATQETPLSLSYQIVTARHGGQLEVRSPLPPAESTNSITAGTQFDVWLPL